MRLWNEEYEIDFFQSALEKFANPEQLFYLLDGKYYAYVPNDKKANSQVKNSRNSLIGSYTEKWCRTLLEPVAHNLKLFAVNGVECSEIGLTRNSSADLAFCTTNDTKQKPENIRLIFEIKMSIISNYSFQDPDKINWIGDYTTHKGNPSLLRSDSMLKAIGKAINIKVSGDQSKKIPIIVIGNSPITAHYVSKVDHLKKSGVIQGFWSLNPSPTAKEHIKNTVGKGFLTVNDSSELLPLCKQLISTDLNYFSSMLSKAKIGELIRVANQEKTDVAKAERFLQLLKG